ncbi:MAG: Druantia anti-phage system protein DruA [Gammaproteobacteria bacterium]
MRDAVTRKYRGRHSWISETKHEGRLVLITTTSALGRSSLYRRIRFEDSPIYISVGFTRGSGEFQFANGVSEDLRRFAVDRCDATAKDARWGKGFRNRRPCSSLTRSTSPTGW